MADPWDLASALVNRSAVRPGDTIWLLKGTYVHPGRTVWHHGFGIDLAGTADRPITIRNYDGQRAIIDGGLNTDQGDPRHLRVWGLEIITSEAMELASQSPDGERHTTYPGSDRRGTELPGPRGGINLIFGHDIKLINNILHDGYGGVGFWGRVSGSSEMHGNIVYDTGWVGPDRYHGHGVYAQNYQIGNIHGDPKLITDNILLDNYATPMKTYGSDQAYVENFFVADNICTPRPTGTEKYVLIGGQRPSTIDPNEVRENLVYAGGLRIGYRDGGDEIRVYENTVVGGRIHYMDFATIDTGNPDLNVSRNWYLNTAGFGNSRYAPGPLSGQGDVTETYQDISETATTSNTWTGAPGADSPRVVEKSPGNLAVELSAASRSGSTTRDIIDGLGNDSGVNRDGFGSFVLNVSELPAGPQRFMYHQRDGGGDPRLSIGVRPDPANAGMFNVGVDDYWGFNDPTFADAPLTPGQDVRIVYQYVYDGWWEGDIRLWIDPAAGDEPAPDVELNQELLDAQQEVVLLQEGGQYELTLDGMLFGETWQDVWNDGSGIPDPIVKLEPNDYEPGRANLAIVQLGTGAETVAVDLGEVLEVGTSFRLVDPEDFWGEPVLEGVYSGQPVDVPVGGDDWAVFVVLPSAQVPLRGDFDLDGAVDAADVTALLGEVFAGTHNRFYDLTGDGKVRRDDADELIHGILGTEYGDANLDGLVGISDLTALADHYGVIGGAGWHMGDFTGDGAVGIADLGLIADYYGSTGPGGESVPEPAVLWMVLGGLAPGLLRRRRIRRLK